MPNEPEDEGYGGSFASPPCFMHEVDPAYGGLVDPRQAADVARWRKAERERLIAARLAIPAAERESHAGLILRHLDELVIAQGGTLVSLYWPFRGEPDLRPWMAAAHARGIRIALPVVVAKSMPLQFREWEPGARLERGVWNIPFPADGAIVEPDVVIAPLVGYDAKGYRLGYGGGFFDRTLAALARKPVAIGVGHPVAELSTIYPQPYDIPMDFIVNGFAPPAKTRAGATSRLPPAP